MYSRTRSAGDILDANCTRCRSLTNHTIVALVDGRVVRVKCNTCGSEHNYHPPKEDKTPAARRVTVPGVRKASPAPVKKDTAPSFHEQWETAMAGKDTTMAKVYGMEGRFSKGEPISHQLFGIGMVTMVAGTKMQVLFRDGQKLLRCGK